MQSCPPISTLKHVLFCLATVFLLALPIRSEADCVVTKPLQVRTVCGYVKSEKSGTWPSTLRLTPRKKGEVRASERILSTDSDGQFTFKNIAPGDYELRVTPAGMQEIFVPVLLKLNSPYSADVCGKPIVLTIDFLPEPCVSPELQQRPSVASLIEMTLKSTSEKKAFADLEALGCSAVPEIIERMDDRRALPDKAITLRNKSPQAWEAMRFYGVERVVDALDAILNQLTGQSFGYIDTNKDESAKDIERERVVRAWREWLQKTPRNKLCGG